jgi:dolichol-phosphate mannosyltransferase
MKLSVVVPVFNESSNLDVLYHRLVPAIESITEDFELIWVNDGSHDDSLKKMKSLAGQDSRLKWIDLSRNFGHQKAISAGIDFASGQAVVTMDGDLQDPPELIPELFEKWQSGFDVVYARRTSRKGEKIYKKVTAFVFYRLLRWISSVDIPTDVGDFRIIDQKVARVLKRMPERNKYLRGQIAWMGFSFGFVSFERDERHTGSSAYSFGQMVNLALNGIFGFSKLPIRLLWWVSGILMFFTIGGLLFEIFDLYPLPQSGIILSLTFLFSLQWAGLALIGEYIYRLFDAQRQRPDYIVNETNCT